MLASPMTIAAGIAGRTKRIKIGTAVQILPLVNPLRIAEDAATVDHVVATASVSGGSTTITLPDGSTMTLVGITHIDSTFFH